MTPTRRKATAVVDRYYDESWRDLGCLNVDRRVHMDRLYCDRHDMLVEDETISAYDMPIALVVAVVNLARHQQSGGSAPWLQKKAAWSALS